MRRLQYKIPGKVCVQQGLKMYPFNMKDAFGKKKQPTLKGSSAHFIPIFGSTIKLRCVVYKGYSQFLTFE